MTPASKRSQRETRTREELHACVNICGLELAGLAITVACDRYGPHHQVPKKEAFTGEHMNPGGRKTTTQWKQTANAIQTLTRVEAR
jgi:hypothetical protein